MWLSMQAAGVDEQPYKGANDWMSVYFLFFVVFCSFFILSLIIGVSIDRVRSLHTSTTPGHSSYRQALCPLTCFFKPALQARHGLCFLNLGKLGTDPYAILGVCYVQFNKLKRTRGVMLSQGQQDWLTLQRMMANTEPKAKYKLPANRTRAVCYHIVLSQVGQVPPLVPLAGESLLCCM